MKMTDEIYPAMAVVLLNGAKNIMAASSAVVSANPSEAEAVIRYMPDPAYLVDRAMTRKEYARYLIRACDWCSKVLREALARPEERLPERETKS